MSQVTVPPRYTLFVNGSREKLASSVQVQRHRDGLKATVKASLVEMEETPPTDYPRLFTDCAEPHATVDVSVFCGQRLIATLPKANFTRCDHADNVEQAHGVLFLEFTGNVRGE